MKTQSIKNKGRSLQQWVVRVIIRVFGLEKDDVKSTSMGSGGEDVQLSPRARKLLPIQIECKSEKSFKTIYKYYEQAKKHGKHEPVLIIKQNRSKPLAIMDAEKFFIMVKK